MKDSFIFYRSFYDASKCLNNDQKAQLFDAVCELALNQNETETEPMVNSLLCLIRPQIEANNKRYENGKKGGRPKTKAKPKRNQTKTKPKPNVNVNVNVNDKKEKIKEKEIYDLYPRKIGGSKAIESITKALTKISYDELKRKVEIYADQSKDTEIQFIPHPTTWFNQERWLDVHGQQIKNNKVFMNLI